MITLKSVSLRRGAKILLDQATATLNPGERVGLVGRNGVGKTTLFALFDGSLHEDAGEFSRPATWRLAQVVQEMPSSGLSATDFVIEGDQALLAAQRQVQLAESEGGDGERLANAYLALHDAGAHDAQARAQALILGLGFKTIELNNPVDSFSGGWRMRLQLARALMCPSDLLLLDEPTNHLDLDALVWLETWLKRYTGTMVVISHDREFLDAVTTVTLHLDNGKLTRYGGNYSTFEETRAQQIDLQQNAYLKQQEKIAHLQSFITRFKAKATKARQAQSRVKALERMERLAPVLTSADFTFEFKEPANLPNPMLVMNNACFGYPPPVDAPAGTPPTVIVQRVNRSVMAGQRIGILGANGQGKSTLVKTIARALPCSSGTISEGKGLNIGYFAQQELDVLRPHETPLQHLLRLAKECLPTGQGDREQDLRSFLGTFNFSGEMVKQTVGTMSGGEKARLVLCMIVWQRPNLLLLDEPTNHLDLATREALAMALNEFEGTVMLVSHDRSLLRSVCDEFWLVTRGGMEDFTGDLDDYQRYLLDEAKRIRESLRESLKCENRPPRRLPRSGGDSGTPGKLKTLQREQGHIEKRLLDLQQEQHTLEARLSTPLSAQELADSGRRLNQIALELSALEEQWLTLSEQIDRATPSVPS
ncbi:MAG: ATP-binding cassette domain-containing protein [Candidatus Accumulibacter phosphatis]|uniref:Probable ATP-binding protein YheS n=1 Tax=Candidatus Accumulibacter cognatus TaxID=2954383 RepID=A0A7D5SER5_9PROT|nr:ATP-binding cassette domain-containing protein [Accumulibacter sp.]MCC2868844.1 ATP-binding cassette domain-containing protein [Candidatus Accumulibacter phosphatis]QLH50438.1 MAG: ATP-binding cassette domain-containing protein [Candidatus Accumulibacter cognatus]MCQ1549396.1 ATP-binding cassette domain-containing protein [Candidatus Accumulibacter phosphatis]HMW54475.1 ATP-binding cassette domain-containing protein [Accumulibacter sp.]HNC19716.1 ATP-binding cassette domain-containing prote